MDSVEHMAGASSYPKLFGRGEAGREGWQIGEEKVFPICYVFAICRPQCHNEASQHLSLNHQCFILFSVTTVQLK